MDHRSRLPADIQPGPTSAPAERRPEGGSGDKGTGDAPVFDGDAPIGRREDDRFGMSAIADRIASSLLGQAGTKGLVMGVEGRWGSGKSSMLSLVLARLREAGEEKVAVVEFRPWLVGDRDQLLTALFDDLAKAVAALERAGGDATGSTVLAAKGVSDKVRSYARHLGPAAKLAGLAGMAVPGLGMVGEMLGKVAEAAAAEAAGPTLSARKDELAASLERLGGRIVVAVDDVDRLEPSETRELLRLVRSVADFPNVAYLLCYDGAALAAAIQTATGVKDGRAYLEKIVQAETTVPRPESFALRRMFSVELATFATCEGEVGERLMQVVDLAGSRSFETPRTVTRVLDSLRLFWPALAGRVDLADLVWLRIAAVASPHLYRWTEEYLDAAAAVATGRATVDARGRSAAAKRLDEALAADCTDWEHVMVELHAVLPRIGWGPSPDGKEDGRVFANGGDTDPAAAAGRRLASPDHSRLYFAMDRAPGSVDVADIEALLGAARDSADAATATLDAMADEANVSGATKAERMLDQLRHVPTDRLRNTDLRNLAFAVIAVAERLADDHGEEWGQPRAWRLAKTTLAAVRRAADASRWTSIVAELFEAAQQLDTLTHLLRDETFDHGVYGDRRAPGDTVTSMQEFGLARDAMFARYRSIEFASILRRPRGASILYAWSQAGGRAEVVELVSVHAAADDDRLLDVTDALRGRTRDRRGRAQSLSPEGLECFFDDVPALLERLLAASAAGNPRASDTVAAVASSLHFHNASIEGWIRHRRGEDPPEEEG